MIKLFRYAIILLTLMFLASCSGEDGEDGKIYVQLSFSSDITSLDASQCGIYPDAYNKYYAYRWYEATAGECRVYWQSNSYYYGGSYYLDVEIDPAEEGEEGSANPITLLGTDGEDGRDRWIKVYLSGSTLYVESDKLENEVGEQPQEALSATQLTPENQSQALEGNFSTLK